MICFASPPTETIYVLLAASPVVIVTPDGFPILLGTYEAATSTVAGPAAGGNITGPLSVGDITGPLSTGTVVGALSAGTVEGPREAC